MPCPIALISFFFFNDTATTEIYTLSLHDALPISPSRARAPRDPRDLGRAGHRSVAAQGRWARVHGLRLLCRPADGGYRRAGAPGAGGGGVVAVPGAGLDVAVGAVAQRAVLGPPALAPAHPAVRGGSASRDPPRPLTGSRVSAGDRCRLGPRQTRARERPGRPRTPSRPSTPARVRALRLVARDAMGDLARTPGRGGDHAPRRGRMV